MKAVILHGGQGTRLRPLTHTGPKQLVKVAGKPISQWVLEQIRDAGIRDIIIVLGDNMPNKVVEYYGDGSRFGVKITYVYQGRARGLADAVYKVRDLIEEGEKFVVYLGDNLVNYDLKRFVSFDSNASILIAKVQDPSRFGVVVIEEGRVTKLVEKPKERISDLALIGVYGFDRNVFDVIERLRPSWRGELEITDAIQGLIDGGFRVTYEVVDGWWKDTGTPKDILEANAFLLDSKINRHISEAKIVNSSIEGRVYLGDSVTIEDSTVRGPAYIGNNTVVKKSYIGPFTSIGDNCSIEDSEVEHSVILDNVRIEGGIYLMDSLIGNNVTIKKGNRWHKLIVGENSWLSL